MGIGIVAEVHGRPLPVYFKTVGLVGKRADGRTVIGKSSEIAVFAVGRHSTPARLGRGAGLLRSHLCGERRSGCRMGLGDAARLGDAVISYRLGRLRPCGRPV